MLDIKPTPSSPTCRDLVRPLRPPAAHAHAEPARAWSFTTAIPTWSGLRMSGISSDEPDLIKDAIANALTDTAEFPGIVRTIDADRAVYSFADARRAH